MKSKLFMLIALLVLIGLTACSEEAETKEDTYTVEEAVSDGHVVIQNTGQTYEDVINGMVKAKNLDELLKFDQKVTNQKEASVKITIFNHDGSYATDTLKYDGELFYHNKRFKGYRAPAGKYECKWIDIQHNYGTLSGCTNEKGEKVSSYSFLIATVNDFREARDELTN